MKIDEKDIKYIERHEIYGNYWKYIEPIINYMCDVGYSINESDSITEFIDNIIYNGYGFVDYNGKLYIIELLEDNEQLVGHDYYENGKDKYVLEPIEIE